MAKITMIFVKTMFPDITSKILQGPSRQMFIENLLNQRRYSSREAPLTLDLLAKQLTF